MINFKQEFFTLFSDQIDFENDYYDSQFENHSPYSVWKWIDTTIKFEKVNALLDFKKTLFENQECATLDLLDEQILILRSEMK